jgi:hypothetical protein
VTAALYKKMNALKASFLTTKAAEEISLQNKPNAHSMNTGFRRWFTDDIYSTVRGWA